MSDQLRYDPKIEWDLESEEYVLNVRRDGVIIRSHGSGGEPEDRHLGDDYSWVKDALREAYELGVKDGATKESIEGTIQVCRVCGCRVADGRTKCVICVDA